MLAFQAWKEKLNMRIEKGELPRALQVDDLDIVDMFYDVKAHSVRMATKEQTAIHNIKTSIMDSKLHKIRHKNNLLLNNKHRKVIPHQNILRHLTLLEEPKLKSKNVAMSKRSSKKGSKKVSRNTIQGSFSRGFSS